MAIRIQLISCSGVVALAGAGAAAYKYTEFSPPQTQTEGYEEGIYGEDEKEIRATVSFYAFACIFSIEL